MRVPVFISFGLLLLLKNSHTAVICTKRCFPDNTCWPEDPEIATFAKSLSGDLYRPSDPEYTDRNTQKYVRVKKNPGIIVYVKSALDVRTAILFAKKHRLMVTIQSSGHSFIGRSTYEGSLSINMRLLNDIQFKLDSGRNDDGEVTVESGNTWSRLYEEVDRVNRVIVGGNDQNVGMGGYTQGGGHSPICRFLGLAVDNLLEVFLITADGRYVTASAEETTIINIDGKSTTIKDTDLFWALRGGGGGTWGVVISFTFKLHKPPPQFVKAEVTFPFITEGSIPGADVMKTFFKLLPNLSPEWGGYLTFSNKPDSENEGNKGQIIISLLHYGKWSNSQLEEIAPITEHTIGHTTDFTNFTYFLDYVRWIKPEEDSPKRIYFINTIMQESNLTDNAVDDFVEELYSQALTSNYWHCIGTLIGGNIRDVQNEATPINPYFRSGLMSTTCRTEWDTADEDETKITKAKDVNQKLRKLGHGVYFNEPPADLSDWKQQFWGENYEKLLEIKELWDPKNFFWCLNCVGSDLRDDPDEKSPQPSSSCYNDDSDEAKPQTTSFTPKDISGEGTSQLVTTSPRDISTGTKPQTTGNYTTHRSDVTTSQPTRTSSQNTTHVENRGPAISSLKDGTLLEEAEPANSSSSPSSSPSSSSRSSSSSSSSPSSSSRSSSSSSPSSSPKDDSSETPEPSGASMNANIQHVYLVMLGFFILSQVI